MCLSRVLAGALTFACLQLFAQDKPPADVDEALRSRITQFYQAHVDGKFRVAEQLVSEDSRDFFFEMEKQRYLSFEPPQITYSENFTKAKVITVVSAEWRIARMGKMIVKPPKTSYWKLNDGQWYWYQFTEKFVETPFGRAVIPDPKDVEAERKTATFKKVTPADILTQVNVSGSAVALNSFEPASGELTVSNNLPGQVTVEVNYPPMDGLTITVDKKVLKSGEIARVIFDCKPKTAVPKGTITANIVVQPLNQIFPITVTFAVPRPARVEGGNK